MDALLRAACHSVGRRLNGVASITKLAEGGFNRVLQITFNDGYAVLARLPYKKTVPKHYAVASEADTLALLRPSLVCVRESCANGDLPMISMRDQKPRYTA